MVVTVLMPSPEATTALLSGLPPGVSVSTDATEVATGAILLTLPPGAMARTLGPTHPYRVVTDLVAHLGGRVLDSDS